MTDTINPRDHRPRSKRKGKGKRRRTSLPFLSAFSYRDSGWLKRIVMMLIVWGMIAAIGGFLYFAYDLPDISNISQIEKKPGRVIRDREGEIAATYGDVYGEYLPYDKLPKPVVEAVLATEDRRFFAHAGIDLIGILRAAWVNMNEGRVVQGGSTITQQLAKNVFLAPERTLRRKIQEALLALMLEAKYSKKEILAIYLNRVYLGAGCFGIDAAAKRYFGKPARELDVAESAMLVGLLKAPSSYSPSASPDKAERRAVQVIMNMKEADYLTKEEADRWAKMVVAGLEYNDTSLGSYYFGDWVMSQLPLMPQLADYLEEDLEIDTTLDRATQRAAEKTLQETLKKYHEKNRVNQGALVTMRPEGEVLALVGGLDYRESQYNRAFVSQRQPGSSFKLFVYLAALEKGLSPDGWMDDTPVQFGRWSPQNYDGKYRGPVSVREAFQQSLNTVAAQVAHDTGVSNVVDMARRLGIASPLAPNLSIALGTSEVNLLELTAAFAHLPNAGNRVAPYGIRRIRTKAGKIIYQRKPAEPEQVLDGNTVGAMNSLLTSVVQGGTGGRAAIGRQVGGKTGTTQDYRDAWFIGFTGNLVTGVWVGNDDNKSMKKVTGGSVPAEIWRDFMKVAEFQYPETYFNTNYVQVYSPAADPYQAQGGPPPAPRNMDGLLDQIFSGPPTVEYEYPRPVRN